MLRVAQKTSVNTLPLPYCFLSKGPGAGWRTRPCLSELPKCPRTHHTLLPTMVPQITVWVFRNKSEVSYLKKDSVGLHTTNKKP